jgi:hypothetical protein
MNAESFNGMVRNAAVENLVSNVCWKNTLRLLTYLRQAIAILITRAIKGSDLEMFRNIQRILNIVTCFFFWGNKQWSPIVCR